MKWQIEQYSTGRVMSEVFFEVEAQGGSSEAVGVRYAPESLTGH